MRWPWSGTKSGTRSDRTCLRCLKIFGEKERARDRGLRARFRCVAFWRYLAVSLPDAAAGCADNTKESSAQQDQAAWLWYRRRRSARCELAADLT